LGYLGTFSLNTANIDSGDTVGWSFTVADSAIDSLKAGQTKTQLYDVTIDDGHGGTIVQTITITLAGANDGTTRTPRRARGNDADSASESGSPGSPYEHGRHGDGADMDGDQIPAPHPAVHDIATLLGAHLQPGEYWV
jgi:VCBS repeat-containing protein